MIVLSFRVVAIAVGIAGRNIVRATTVMMARKRMMMMVMMAMLENVIIKRSFTHTLLALCATIVRDFGRVRRVARLAMQCIVGLYEKIAITIT